MMHSGFDAEEGRRPQHQIGELALFHRADSALRRHARSRGFDGVFRNVALDPEIIVVAFVLGELARAASFILSAVLPGPDDDFAEPAPWACESDDIIDSAPRSCRDIFCRDGLLADAAFRQTQDPRRSKDRGWWQTISMSRCSSIGVAG